MKNKVKDEVLEELWSIKDQFSNHGKRKMRDLVNKANQIAKEKGFDKSESMDPGSSSLTTL